MPHLQRRRLRVPAADGEVLIDPPLTNVAATIQGNRRIAPEFDRQPDLPPNFRTLARAILAMNAAQRAGKSLSDAEVKAEAQRPVILTGHQPELFHPGVWFKNFLACSIAQHVGGHAFNLVVDNDVVRSASIRVPTRADGQAQVVEVPFDAAAQPVPWENRRIANPSIFTDFARQVHHSFDSVIARGAAGPLLLDRLWPYATAAMEERNRQGREHLQSFAGQANVEIPTEGVQFAGLDDCLANARNQVERDCGISITDYPLKQCSREPPFLAFTRLLFLRHRELHAIYNAALVEYRHVNHIRSQSHPVPELAQQDDWHEIPYWLWTYRKPQRRRAFLRAAGGGFEVTDREDVSVQVPADWPQFRAAMLTSRFNLRPRALITTMYARLVLSDLFIHGIGGAKYDELTDSIIRRFFGIDPPAYVTATATFRLPIDRPNASLNDVRASVQRLRDLRHRPESFLREQRVQQDADLVQELAALAAEKRDYLAQHDLRCCSPDIFNKLDALNRAMHDLLRLVEEELRAQHTELIALARQSQLLSSREFSFVLFPAEKLSARLLDLSKQIS